MEIYTYENNAYIKQETGVALGNFDGLHLGHQKLIKTITTECSRKGLKSSILLFNNHTKTTLDEKSNLKILTSNEQKLDILDSLGVELIYTMNFNSSVMKLTPEEFATKILVEKMKAKLVVVGFNYRFGYKAKGDANYLRKLGAKLGFEVIIVEPVYDDNQVISSTLIRELIKNGYIEKANRLLYSPYTIEGKVVSGKKRGKKLGFPTANLKLVYNYLIPRYGVYATKTIIDNVEYNSLTNVGTNPTFDNDICSIESHIFDFNKDIYNNKIKIRFLKYLREDKKFNTKEDLIEQINKDKKNIIKQC